MQKILTEWHKYLNEQTYKEVDALRKKIFAANGNIKLSIDQLGQLTKYVDYNYKSDPLGAAQAAAAIKVYYRANKDAAGAAAIVRKYAKLEKHFNGLAPQAGRSPTVRAVDAFLGAKDPVVEKGLYTSKERPAFAKHIIDIATNVKSSTGIRILDPTMPATPPDWAKQHPDTYKTFQFLADFFASDPFTAAAFFLPAGSVGKAAQLRQSAKIRSGFAAGLKRASRAAARGDAKATQQIIKKTVQDTQKIIDDLAHYVKTTGQDMSPSKAKSLLSLAKQGAASLYKGNAYRGLQIIDAEHLLKIQQKI